MENLISIAKQQRRKIQQQLNDLRDEFNNGDNRRGNDNDDDDEYYYYGDNERRPTRRRRARGAGFLGNSSGSSDDDDDDSTRQQEDHSNNNNMMMEMMKPVSLASMIIGSVDTIREKEIDQTISSLWNDQPPLLIGPRGQQETTTLLKGLLRRNGIPPALRCAVWLSNIIQAVHHHEDSDYWHEYRSLAKVRPLDYAYQTLITKIIHDNSNSNEQQQNQQEQSTTSGSSTKDHDNKDDFWKNMKTPTLGRTSNMMTVVAGRTSTDHNNDYNNDSFLLVIPDVTDRGRLAHRRVMIALEQVLGMDYAPLIPVLVSLLLTSMSESYAFCSIREMSNDPVWYLPITKREHRAYCLTFIDIFHKLHPSTAEYLDDRGVFDIEQLQPIFANMFVHVLPIQYVLRIVDLYTLEGMKVLFRFGVSLFVLYKMIAARRLITISNATEWWNGFIDWTYDRHIDHGDDWSSKFDFDLVVRKAYGVHVGNGVGGGGVVANMKARRGRARKAAAAASNNDNNNNNNGGGAGVHVRFPRRNVLWRIIRMEEQRVATEMEQNDDDEEEYREAPAKPLGLVIHNNDDAAAGDRNDIIKRMKQAATDAMMDGDEIAKPVLTKNIIIRQYLAQWLPVTLRLTDLELVYSTNHHGRSLDMFYRNVSKIKHTILVCEVLVTTKSRHSSSEEQGKDVDDDRVIIGMYASQPWQQTTKVYGDGGCFLFRIQPNPQCWKWKPPSTSNKIKQQDEQTSLTSGNRKNNIIDSVDLDEDDDDDDDNDSNDGGNGSTTSTSSNNRTALLEQFMVSTRSYISMGGNPDGTCGLRFNDDFTHGESSTAVGFDNDPLHHLQPTPKQNEQHHNNNNSNQKQQQQQQHQHGNSVFDVGLVEVYRLVRQIDGKAI